MHLPYLTKSVPVDDDDAVALQTDPAVGLESAKCHTDGLRIDAGQRREVVGAEIVYHPHDITVAAAKPFS